MTEQNGVEQEQQAPARRETASGPLLPRWFTTPFYTVFGLFCVYSVIHIGRSVRMQQTLTEAVNVVKGDAERAAADFDSPEGQQAILQLERHPREAFLYVNEELLQDEDKDGRMARAMALRKAVDWGRDSARRDVIERILANMTDEGAVAAGFTLDEKTRQVLEEMVAERRANPELTYVEDRITDVLDWLAKGHPGQPKGPERRRLRALADLYAKRVFLGAEERALTALMAEWRDDPDPVAQGAADAFEKMLALQRTELSPEAEALCTQRADEWEQRYREGMTRLAQAGVRMTERIVGERMFLDHPHIYQCLTLLNHRFEEVRETVATEAWVLRHNQFAIRFLAHLATSTAINPLMAVETVRLTREENERQMRRAKDRRMREAVRLLGRIGVDYIKNRQDYDLGVKDPDDFIRAQIVGSLTEIIDEQVVTDLVQEALANLREADLARPEGPLLFQVAAE
ncbi:MAG: hypothetical protein ACYTFZ_03555 [Planctomycetota bacterium]|jgi:hypothetical protein